MTDFSRLKSSGRRSPLATLIARWEIRTDTGAEAPHTLNNVDAFKPLHAPVRRAASRATCAKGLRYGLRFTRRNWPTSQIRATRSALTQIQVLRLVARFTVHPASSPVVSRRAGSKRDVRRIISDCHMRQMVLLIGTGDNE